jgi:hypothetical protein
MGLGMLPQSLSLSSACRAGFSSKLFDHRAARKWALCSHCTVSYVGPPEPTTTIIHHGRASLLSFFASPPTCSAESFPYYRSMAWIDSTKKIRPKTSSRNDVSAIFSAKRQHRHFLRHGEENAGYLLISVVFLLTAFLNIRTAMCFEYSKKRQTKISYR